MADEMRPKRFSNWNHQYKKRTDEKKRQGEEKPALDEEREREKHLRPTCPHLCPARLTRSTVGRFGITVQSRRGAVSCGRLVAYGRAATRTAWIDTKTSAPLSEKGE